MKLLIGSSSPLFGLTLGGISSYAGDLAAYLARAGHEVYYASPDSDHLDRFDELNLRHIKTGMHDDPELACRRLLATIRDQGIEGVINNDNTYIQTIAPASPVPVISVCHATFTSIPTLACLNSQWLDHIVVISNDMLQILTRRFDIPVLKYSLVYNGISSARSAIPKKQEDGQLRVVFVGADRNKGTDLIVKCVQQGADAWKGIQLSIFGAQKSYARKVFQAAPYVELHDRVPRTEFISRLAEAQVLMFPSRVEGCPMTMLEAMGLGAVPLTSDGRGAMREIIANGHNGFMLPLADWPQQAMLCLHYLRDHANMRQAMAEAAYERVKTGFKMEQTAEHLIRLLNRPTVRREKPAKKIDLIRWHRPTKPGTRVMPFPDRVYFKLGKLRKAGQLTFDTATI